MYAYKLNVLNEAEIEAQLILRFKGICQLVNENIHWHSRGIKNVHSKENGFLVEFLTQCHDLYLMLAKFLDPESNCIAQEITVRLITFFQNKTTMSYSEKEGFVSLKNRTWWRILIEKLASRQQNLALERGESGVRGIPLTKADALTDSYCNVYGIILKFCQEIVPVLVNPKGKIKVVAAISPEFHEKASELKKAAAIDDVLAQLGDRIKYSYPNLLLKDATADLPEAQRKLYNSFLPKMNIVGHVQTCSSVKLRFDYMRCKGPSKGTLVFISDLLHDRTEWSLVHPRFSDEYDILVFDLPGSGLTQTNGARFSIETIVEHLHRLLLRLDITAPHLIGHGFGGCVAAELFKRYRISHSKLILLNVPYKLLPADSMAAYQHLIRRSPVSVKDVAAQEVFLLTYIALFYAKVDQMHAVLAHKAVLLPNFDAIDLQHQLQSYIEYNQSFQMLGALRNLNKYNNVLCLKSEHNALLGDSTCQLPVDIKCLRATLPEVGHGVLDEHPDIVVQHIKDHLDKLRPTGMPIMRCQTEPYIATHVKPQRPLRRSQSALF